MTDPAPAWRKPTPRESVLLAQAVSGDWPGADVLRSQLPGLLVRVGCSCGCGTIDLQTSQGEPAPAASSSVPREGVVFDDAGRDVGSLLLFLKGGLLHALEIAAYEDPLPLPAPDRVQWVMAQR